MDEDDAANRLPVLLVPGGRVCVPCVHVGLKKEKKGREGTCDQVELGNALGGTSP